MGKLWAVVPTTTPNTSTTMFPGASRTRSIVDQTIWVLVAAAINKANKEPSQSSRILGSECSRWVALVAASATVSHTILNHIGAIGQEPRCQFSPRQSAIKVFRLDKVWREEPLLRIKRMDRWLLLKHIWKTVATMCLDLSPSHSDKAK